MEQAEIVDMRNERKRKIAQWAKGEIGAWMRKANESAKTNGATVVCLVPARTDTNWWHQYAIQHEVRFVRGRLKFGDAKNSAPFPSAVVVIKPDSR